MNEGLNAKLRFGSAKHTKILAALLARKKKAKDKVDERQSDFAGYEEIYDAYLPDTETRRLRREKFKTGDPDYYTVVIPYSYAALLTAHTYWTSVFLSRTPVLQYTGRHGESMMKTQAVEAIMDYQVLVGNMLGPMYHWLHDAPKYGYGIVHDYWEKEIIQTSRIEERPITFLGAPLFGKTKRVKTTSRSIGYNGNKLLNVHPAHFWPDWRVPLSSFQEGEFVARLVHLSWNSLIKGKHQGRYFNLDVIEKMASSHSSSFNSWEGGRSTELPEYEGDVALDIANISTQEGFEIVIDLIPKEWELGTSTYPEKWIFTILHDKVIVEARPQARAHGRFPYSVLPLDFDAYKLFSTSMLDRLEPLNDVITWLVNQHFFNVRAGLNNNFIYDPSRVVVKDLHRKGASKLIRLKENAYGTDINKVIQQLPVADLTRGHMADASNISELFDKVFGINANLMGQIHQGGRKTATEIRTSSTFGINRLKTVAEYWSAVGFAPMSQRLLQNTQELYDQEQQFKIAGGLAADAQFINVAPELIAGLYDFVPVDGTMPVDRYAQANLWKELLIGVQKMPQVAMKYDLGGIFSWMAQLAGLKNIKQFEIQLTPDAAIAQNVGAGNLVPAGKAVQNLNEPGQVSGMGPTG